MIPYPDIDPVIFEVGPLAVRWYGLMYVIGFAIAWGLGRHRARQMLPDGFWPRGAAPATPVPSREKGKSKGKDGKAKTAPGQAGTVLWVDDLIFYSALGVIIGGRVFYMLVYGWADLVADPLSMFKLNQGGMSFHGGLLGVLAAMWYLAHRAGKTFFEATDFVAPLVPLGLGFGRIGNFINGELWGKPTDVPWAFIVEGRALHPSQLYEALLEGFVLFAILWVYSGKRPPRMAVSGAFLVGYGVFRFLVEFVRVPDAHLQYLLWDWVTMGQILSAPMIVFGALLLYLAYRRPAIAPAQASR